MHSPSSLLFVAAAALAACAGGCVDTDPAVFVEASIAAPAAVVSAGALGTDLSASFQLRLHLGARASGPSQVNARTFEITNADQTTSIVAPLEVTTTTTLPVEVAQGGDVVVDFAFDSMTTAVPLPTEAYGALCDPAGIRITGSIEDSLEDGATPVASDVFHAGCM